MTNSFSKWLDTFLEEKGIDREYSFTIEGASGPNLMSYEIIIEHMKITGPQEQAALKDMLVKIDFHNASVTDYLRHLAQAIAL